MQRSRRALLERTAAAAQEQSEGAAAGRKRRLYGFSASVVVASWDYIDGGGSAVALAVVEPTLNEDSVNPSVQQEHEGNMAVSGDTCVKLDETVALSEEILLQKDQLWSKDEAQNDDAKALTKDSQVELSEGQGESLPLTNVDSGVYPMGKVEGEDVPRPARLSRVVPPGLDEFKTRAIAKRGKDASNQTSNVIHRREPSGKLYNYILDKDKDKYLRNPYSAEGKFVIIELSEETLVDTIAIANFEHYSSNLKEFEMLSSLNDGLLSSHHRAF